MDDYKRKYEEALGRARTFSQKWQGIEATDSELALQELKEIFPELKESEDERIRKSIIDLVEKQMPKSENKKWMIAWLEKQGEQKPIISDDAIREGVAHFGITQYQITNWLKKYVDVKKQGEQKPSDKVEPKKELKKIEQTYFQKKKWTGYDEKAYEIALLDIDKSPSITKNDTIDWLKSLKEKYAWKPSDEQMEALLKLEEMHVLEHEKNQENAHLYMVIKSLKEQLLKLKGE